jgi:hypothetical protein
MAGENADVLRQSQLGIQNSLFTAVGANVLIEGVSVEPKPVIASAMLYTRGEKAAVAQVDAKGSHTTAKLTGFAGYNDLTYILSLLLKAATISTPVGATTARDWAWILLPGAAETPKYATFECGISGTDLARFGDANLTSLKLSFEKNKEVSVEGDIIGTNLSDEGVTATSSPTLITSVPLSVNLMDAYVADTIGGLSTGLLGAMYKCSLSIADRRQPVFPIRSDRKSWGGTVERRNKVVSHIEIQHDTQSYNAMRQIRASNTRYLRYLLTGPQIEPGFNYEFEVTQPFKVTSPDRGPADEVYQGMYDLESVKDATLGGFLKIRLRCKLASLISSTDLASDQQPDALVSALTPPGFS